MSRLPFGRPQARIPSNGTSLLLMVLAVSTLTACNCSVLTQSDAEKTYGVILDCGSSGTRVNIYYWDTKLNYPELLEKIELLRDEKGEVIKSKQFKPPLAKLVEWKPDQRERHFAKLMDYVASKIPESRHAFTVIYLMATAGMRLLDESEQDDIKTPFTNFVYKNYKFKEVQASVISGAKEGLYRWISVNAKAGRFLGQKTDGRTKTYAVIEMGGASVQVVYQLKFGDSKLFEHVLKSDGGHSLAEIYRAQIVEPQISRKNDAEHRYKLHSTTFLGFGGDSAQSAFYDLLIAKQHNKDAIKRFLQVTALKARRWWNNMIRMIPCRSGSKCPSPKLASGRDRKAQKARKSNEEPILTIEDPCAPTGYESDLFKKPTRMLDNKRQTIGFIVDEDDEKKGRVFSFQVKGRGDYNKCRRYVEEMLWLARSERLNCKPDELCTMELLGQRFIPWESTDFVGIGDFYYTSNTMLELDGQYNHDLIVVKTEEICKKSERGLKELFTAVAEGSHSDRIHTECFRAVWMDTFLVRGLRMDPDFDSLKTMDKINGQNADWTQGAVMDKSLAIEEATEIPREELVDEI